MTDYPLECAWCDVEYASQKRTTIGYQIDGHWVYREPMLDVMTRVGGVCPQHKGEIKFTIPNSD